MKWLQNLVIFIGTMFAVAYTLVLVDAIFFDTFQAGRLFQSDDQIFYAHLVVIMTLIFMVSFFMREAHLSERRMREWFLTGCYLGVVIFMRIIFKYSWSTLSDTAKFVGIIAVTIVLILYVGLILPEVRRRFK